MNTNLYIPLNINVGYQLRQDTYTGRLAYVIYFDHKNILRKESSWNSWRDEKLANNIYKNIPTSGFVLDRDAGGYRSDWNYRQSMIRVFDPRGFEFEITPRNLLYILKFVSSISGMALDGEFVYSWDKTDLVLLPLKSVDYQEINNYNNTLQSGNKIASKELIIGATYQTKDNKNVVYMGRYDKWHNVPVYDYSSREYVYDLSQAKNLGKFYWFRHIEDNVFVKWSGINNRLISCVDQMCHFDYARLFDLMECDKEYSPIDSSNTKIVKYSFEEFCERFRITRHFLIVNNSGKFDSVRVYEGNVRQCLYYFRKDGDYHNPVDVNSMEELYHKLNPVYIEKYLVNGKIYSKEK